MTNLTLSRRLRTHALALLSVMALIMPLSAHSADFNATIEAAHGQTVYFNAWGGDDKINDYIAWAGEELKARHGISLKHVKLADAGNAVSRILAERPQAGPVAGRSIFSG